MGSVTGSKVAGYQCRRCLWVAVVTALPDRCHRCNRLARHLKVLDRRGLIALVDSGAAGWCEPCGVIHGY